MLNTALAFIPAPPSDSLVIGGRTVVHYYGVCIVVGMLVSVWWSGKRWEALGGKADDIQRLAMWALPAGVLGARLYHVATDWRSYTDNPIDALKIWNGGLGIWGGIAAGTLAVYIVARRSGMNTGLLGNAIAVTLLAGQAIGRLGNWFNQELYGRPTTIPIALKVDPEYRVAPYELYETFHAAFLYEILWNVLIVIPVMLFVEKRKWLRPGYIFGVYVFTYCIGRYAIEQIRIDPASVIFGQRVNEWVAIIVGLGGLAFALYGRNTNQSPEVPSNPEALVAAKAEGES